MAQIKTLVEKSGEQILPRTRVEAITLSDGTTNLEDFLITFEEGQLAADLNFDATSLNTSTWADVKEDIIPSTSELSLGSAAKPWKELYLSSGSLHLGDVKLSTETGSLVVASATTGDPIPVDAATLNGFTSDDFATPQYVQDQVSGLVDAAPSTLNTLNELAAALGDDANYAATVTSALGQKAPINNPTFTGTVSGISAAMVGLGNVNNTSDANKPISIATQTALDAKVDDVEMTSVQKKNWIINGGFDVWQRGTSQTADGYGSDDRWSNNHGVSTKTHSRQTFTIGQTEIPNNPTYYSRTVVTSGNTSTSLIIKAQGIEDVTKLAGKTVSLSFWAKADTSKNISIEFRQVFGTGGSAEVNTISVQKFGLTTSWQRFTKTFTLPSISGKTIGAGSKTTIAFWLDAGSDYNARTDSLGNQSGTFDIANVSLVEGSVPVEWQTESYADVLRQCQRFYEPVSNAGITIPPGFVTSLPNGNSYQSMPILTLPYKITKRISPNYIWTIAANGFSYPASGSGNIIESSTSGNIVIRGDENIAYLAFVSGDFALPGNPYIYGFILYADAEL